MEPCSRTIAFIGREACCAIVDLSFISNEPVATIWRRRKQHKIAARIFGKKMSQHKENKKKE